VVDEREVRVPVEESAEDNSLELPKLLFVFEACRLIDAERAKREIEEWLTNASKRVLIIEAVAGPRSGWLAPRVVIHAVSMNPDVLRELPKVELHCHIEGGEEVIAPAKIE